MRKPSPLHLIGAYPYDPRSSQYDQGGYGGSTGPTSMYERPMSRGFGTPSLAGPAIAGALGIRPNLSQQPQNEWQPQTNSASQTSQTAPMDPLLWAQRNAPDLFAEYRRLQNNRDPREYGKDRALLEQIKQMADAAAADENMRMEQARQQEQAAYQLQQQRNQSAYSLQQQRDEENRRKALILGGRGMTGNNSIAGDYGSPPEKVVTGVMADNTKVYGRKRW